MEIWLFCRTFLLFVAVLCKISLANDDNTFKLKRNNFSKELNEFLTNVLQHRDDFKFVRNAARFYRKTKTNVPEQDNKFQYLPDEQDVLNEEISSLLQNRRKRHLPNSRKMKIKSFPASRDKAPMDFENSLHKTLVKSKFKTATTAPATPDYAVINIADLEQKAIDDKRSIDLSDNSEISSDYNDPNGNDLYSVNFGQNDLIDAYEDQPMQFNQKFIETNRQYPDQHKFISQHNRPINNYNKFIDDYITNSDTEDFYNLNQRSKRDDKNGKFQSRQLKFFSDTMMDFNDNYNDADDYNWERTRRDFLDKLHMDDEENFSEDNPYLEELKDNNTNVMNDTRIHHHLKANHPDLFEKIKKILNKKSEKSSNLTRAHKRELVGDANQINTNNFEQSASNSKDTQPSMLDKIKQIFQKKSKNSTHPTKREELKFEDFNDIIENDGNTGDKEVRLSRNSPRRPKKIETNQDIVDHLVNQLKYPKIEPDEDGDNIVDEYRQIVNQHDNATGGHDVADDNVKKLINGQLSSKIVTLVFKELPPMNQLKKGLSRRHFNYQFVDTGNLIGNNTHVVTKDLLERLAESLTVFINKEIHHINCHHLSDDLSDFLKDLVQIQENYRSTSEHTPYSHQDFRFLFDHHPPNRHHVTLRKRTLERTLLTLENLLDNYNNLSSDSQNQAKPVKDYIEKHIVTLKSLISNGVIDNTLTNNGGELKFNMKRETKGKSYKSEQYKKLQRAVQQIREKRANEKKIGELFGKEMKRGPKFDINYEQPVVFNIA